MLSIMPVLERASPQNVLRVIRNPVFGIRQSIAIVQFNLHRHAIVPYLTTALHAPEREIRRYVEEAVTLGKEAKERAIHGGVVGNVSRLDFSLLYATVRFLQPATMIETGVASGVSTQAILAAMEANKTGHLHSISLPAMQSSEGVHADGMRYDQAYGDSGCVGWLVPVSLRHRWSLTLGDVREELVPLLDRLGDIDIFFHDDLHTPEHMRWEFETIWPCLAPGGALIADDITYGWSGFMAKVRLPPWDNLDGMAVVRKPLPDQ